MEKNINCYEKYIGTLLDGKYQIEKCLGIGGMAAVMLARDIGKDIHVAIKMLRDEYSEDTDAIDRFKSEAQAVSMLSHPNVVGIHDICLDGDVKYLVMEYVEGVSLRAYMDKRGKLSFAEVSSISEQILAALNHAHSCGIIHRDIKPQNIMLLKDGFVKVMDFGIAKLPEVDTVMTGEAIGTVYYISPEQAEGKPYDTRADLYSVGVLMYEMATGKLPFDDEHPVSVVMMQIHDKPIPPRRIDRKISRGLETIILCSMEKNPQKRYQSALDMLRELRRIRLHPTAVVLTPKKVARKKRSEKNLKENPPSTATFPVILGVAVAMFFATIISLFYIINNLTGGAAAESVKVPTVEGLAYTTNAELGFNENFNVSVEYVHSPNFASGVIISQEPSGGANRKVPCAVTLKVSLGPEMVTLNDYTIMDWRDAYTKLREQNFIVTKVFAENSAMPAGFVYATEPAAGSKLEIGSAVTIYISSGAPTAVTTVPNFFGLSERAAKKALDESKLLLGNITYTRSSLPAGTVICFTPESGATAYPNITSVDFVISAGKDYPTNYFPNVVGQKLDDVNLLLDSLALTVFVSTVANDAPTGTIIAQTPTPSSASTSSVSINLTVSGGPDYQAPPVRLPSLVGLPIESAKSGITSMGFTVGEVVYKKSDKPEGTVLSQTPASGESMIPGAPESVVNLTVSGGPNFIPPTVSAVVPNVLGMNVESARALLKENGFIIRNITYTVSAEANDTVLWQSETANSTVSGPEGEIPIDLIVAINS
jgi:serine/threonine-protein kinase